MPIIEVKAFGHRFEDDGKAALLIERLTAAMGDVYGAKVAEETQVVLSGVEPRHWGFGGARRLDS
jgi:phenylpyruvate tautomerase PptA (4-oxalocrotonate tautomerase family)